jgi:hypothetical protein
LRNLDGAESGQYGALALHGINTAPYFRGAEPVRRVILPGWAPKHSRRGRNLSERSRRRETMILPERLNTPSIETECARSCCETLRFLYTFIGHHDRKIRNAGGNPQPNPPSDTIPRE